MSYVKLPDGTGNLVLSFAMAEWIRKSHQTKIQEYYSKAMPCSDQLYHYFCLQKKRFIPAKETILTKTT